MDPLANSPGFLIRRCYQASLGVFLQETAGHDLRPAPYGALVRIAAEPGMLQCRLMEIAALDRSTVAKCVAKLEHRGLIERKVDPLDRRTRRLYPTPEGLKALEAMQSSYRRCEERLLAPLGEERARQFVGLLLEFIDAHSEVESVRYD